MMAGRKGSGIARTHVATIAAGLLVAMSQSAFAGDGITFKYDAVYEKMQDMHGKLQPLNDVQPVMKLTSAECGVDFSKVTLQLRGGGITPETLSIDRLGWVSLPLDAKLYKSDYGLVSNQQHDLAYDVKMRLMVSSTDLSYQDLAQLEADFRQGLHAVGGFIAYHVMVPQGLVFVYAEGNPSVVVSSQKGAHTIAAQPADGYHGLPTGASIIRLPLDPQADDLKERIRLQRLPDDVDVMFAPDIEQKVAEQYASDHSQCKPGTSSSGP